MHGFVIYGRSPYMCDTVIARNVVCDEAIQETSKKLSLSSKGSIYSIRVRDCDFCKARTQQNRGLLRGEMLLPPFTPTDYTPRNINLFQKTRVFNRGEYMLLKLFKNFHDYRKLLYTLHSRGC